MNCPELMALGSVEMSRLMGSLQPQTFKAGETLYEKGAIAGKVILIEKGSAVINLPPSLTDATMEEVDEQLGIIRPSDRRKSVAVMSTTELYAYLHTSDGNNKAQSNSDSPRHAHRNVEGSVMVYEGCILGFAALRAKAQQTDYYHWTWSTDGRVDVVKCPIQVQAVDPIQSSVFSVELFERLYGPVKDVFRALDAARQSNASRPNNDHDHHDISIDNSKISEEEKAHQMHFEESHFSFLQVLGRGSYGIVMLARHQPTGSLYALKRLSKIGVMETGQLRHVMDERKLISSLQSLFVAHVYGSYQTPCELVLVTECLNRGDLWSVIYENPVYRKGIPAELIRFYCGSIVLALHHIHSKGIAYRDLKPENIMLDETGNLRVIDFGFAKKIPYTTEEGGEVKVHVKSYTLCGTPEYLAPEFIFNTGNDHSVDLWALGVMMHEMYLCKTPFNPKRRNDMTELFTNIASVKRNGIALSSTIDSRDGSPHARVLISQLLRAEPTDRISYQEGSTNFILDHKFFSKTDIAALERRELVPIFIPDAKPPNPANLNVSVDFKPYLGEDVFSGF